jgi:HAD superfamily hydrolase (TIGR01549 family)/HAD superfamily hydrolase (TIGR01509 family)
MGGTVETFWSTADLRLKAIPDLQLMLQSAGIELHLDDKELCDVVTTGLDRYHKWSLESLEELPVGKVWSEYIFSDFSLEQEKIKRIAQDLMLYVETRFYHREMRPEMPAVLDAIKKMNLKIGIISNVCSKNQVPANLERYGIRHYFDPIIMSSEYGRRKPDPAIFHYAARMADVPTGECAYIGDRIARDILGARRAGYRLAVLIRHNFEHGEDDSGATPDATITHMTEFLTILQTELLDSTNSTSEQDPQNPIRALLFDAGDILYYRKHCGHKLREFINDLGLTYKELPEAERTKLRDQAYQGLITYDQYQESILRYHGVTHPVQIARGKQILDADANNVQFFDGVRETLNSLKSKGFLLGIVTDTALPVHVKLKWFEHGGFGDVWDSIVSSRELGFRKPNPEIYQVALQQLGISADQAVFIGHKISELNGAKAVGIKTIAFNYEDGATADFHIDHFSDLLKVPLISRSESIKQV